MLDSSARSVLLVEDNPIDVFIMRVTFRQVSPEIRFYTVKDGREAIGYLEGLEPYHDRERYPFPDLMVVDLRLPNVSGAELLTWVRSQPKFDDLPVVLTTGYENPERLDNLHGLGADICLLKPLPLNELTDIMQAFHLL